MGRYDGLAVLVGVALLLWTGQCSDSCQAQDGRPGEAGVAGRDGRPGQKGEKGEQAPSAAGPPDPSVLIRLRGDVGSRGVQGTMGPKGYHGDLGPLGVPGRAGPPGPDGRRFSLNAESLAEAQSAFSVRTNTTRHPGYKTITFDVSLLMKPSADFDLATGHFTCRVPGIYYFVFHSMSKVTMCVRLVSDILGQEKLGFCDYNTRGRPQVLSGGVVLQLAAGDKVWLESFRDSQPDSVVRDAQEKMILFNGFLIF